MKREVLLIVSGFVIFFFIFSLRVSAADNSTMGECFPEYHCGEWAECIEGLRSRVCEDLKCGRRDIIERKFCDELTCKPEIKCTEWSECVYTDKTEDIFGGKIRFGGYRSRACRDLTGCVDNFNEESTCEETFDLELKEISQCNQTYMVAIDPLSGREIAKISLTAWENKRLDLIFTEGKSPYCPSCYNGIKDEEEEDIDCGGTCKECRVEKEIPLKAFIFGFWTLSLAFLALTLREIIFSRRENKKSGPKLK